MVYSCAYFENGDEDLATAQLKKIDHILTKIELKPGQTLLDIGCGWGALVIRAAQKFGARCVGVTLSQNQFDLATERVRAAGLQDRIEIRLQDYRDVTGQFDRITSVGMFEHVGRKNLPAYFKRVQQLLADDGVVMNHGITSSDPEGGGVSYGGGDFIDRYVFPNGELPHISLALQAMQQGGLEAFDVENLRRHYAQTLRHWSDAYEANARSCTRWSTKKSSASGACTWPAARMPSRTTTWPSTRSSGARRAAAAKTLPWSRRYIYDGTSALNAS
jgi:cyclopropane-fatty-acyl-phospholipid synthase